MADSAKQVEFFWESYQVNESHKDKLFQECEERVELLFQFRPEKLIENDRYIRREDHYTNMHEKSIEDIQMMYKGLSEHYDRNDIKAEELPVLLEKYYDQPDAGDLFAGKSLDYFKKSLYP